MYFVYKTINKLNGKFYIGVHHTKEDNYLGSGKYLNEAIKFHGKKSFEKIILHECLTREEALKIEMLLVTEEFILREDTYNLTVGGGMPPTFSKETHPQWGKKKPWASERMKTNNPVYLPHVMELNKSTITVKDQNGNCFRIAKNDPRFISGEVVPVNKGRKPFYTGKTMPKKKCPYCGHEGAGGSMIRWHFENCKRKEASV